MTAVLKRKEKERKKRRKDGQFYPATLGERQIFIASDKRTVRCMRTWLFRFRCDAAVDGTMEVSEFIRDPTR